MSEQGLPVRIFKENGRSKARLTEDIEFDLLSNCSRDYRTSPLVEIQRKHVVKAGFLTDGASIPRLFWSIVGSPFEGGPLRAAVFHDSICDLALTQRARRDGDNQFIWIMEEDGVPWLQRYAMFYAVRLYGFWVWPIVRYFASRGRKVRPE